MSLTEKQKKVTGYYKADEYEIKQKFSETEERILDSRIFRFVVKGSFSFHL